MPGAERAEIYFIAGMMVLILILSFAAVYIFIRQYKKETREKNTRVEQREVERRNGDS